MYWENPSFLWGLWVLPIVCGLLIYAYRRRKSAARKFADPAMVARLMPAFHGARPWIKGTLLLVGLALLIAATARPRFGEYFEVVSQRGVDLFVLLDVSRSMLAEDVAPSRLERAKSDVRDLLTHLKGDRVGLIVFAGKPILKVPLTLDQGFFQLVLEEVDTSSAPRGGSLIGDAIRKGLDAMPERRDRDQVMVLITDGEDQSSFPREAAKQAAQRGVKILTVGLGNSEEGARIPLRDEDGQLRYLKFEGQEVWSTVDEQLLKEIALATGAAYIPAGTRAYDLGAIYADQTAKLNRGTFGEEKRKRYREQFQPFVCLGVLLLLIDMLIPNYRRAELGETGRELRQAALVIGLAIGWLALNDSTALAGTGDAARSVDEGIRFYQAEQFEQAGKAFAAADVALPDDPWVEFDRACAYRGQGDIEKARQLFQRSALARDAQLAANSHYNLGDLDVAEARAVFGEHPENATPDIREQGTRLLLTAVRHYRDCLNVDPQHEDARHNLEVIRIWLKHMQAVWKEKDRQKNREEMNLLQFLQMLETQQRTVRTSTRGLSQQPESPQRRQAIKSLEETQRELSEEIQPLIEKIQQELQPNATPNAGAVGGPANSSAPAMSPDQAAHAVGLLTDIANQAGQAMQNAADRLDGQLLSDAVTQQATAIEKLDEIYMAIVPFPGMVSRSVATQQGLIDSVEPALPVDEPTAEPTEADQTVETGASSPESNVVPNAEEKESVVDDAMPLDYGELAWDQRFVTRWAEVLGPKAKQTLKSLSENASYNVPRPSTDPGAAAEAEAKQQEQALKKALEKAVELAPEIAPIAGEAADLLEQQQPADAHPKQQRALEMLREIAELLPKQDQQKQPPQNQDQNQQDNQQQQQDQQQQDQQKQQQREQEQQEQQQQQSAKKLSQRQAEAALRKVRERQRKRRELEKELNRQIYRPEAVERDW
jgi:Ca-activated chloride channel family protein